MNKRRPECLRPWWQVLLLLVMTTLPYLPTLRAPFTGDDVLVATENPMLANAGNIPRYFASDVDWLVPPQLGDKLPGQSRSGLYRPVLASSYHLDYAFFGLWAPGWRLVNLVLHLLVTVLVWWLVRLLGAGAPAAGLAALLFAWHPAHAEAVGSLLGGRSELLAALFCLAAGGSFIAAGRAAGKKKIYLVLAAALSFFLGLCSKENALMLPVVLGFYLWLGRRQSITNCLRALLPLGLVLALYLPLRLWVVGRVAPSSWEATFGPLPGWQMLLVGAAIQVMYLVWALWPLPYRHPDCWQDFPARLPLPLAVGATLFLLALLGLAVWRLARSGDSRWRTAALLVVLFYLLLLPVAQLVPFRVVMAQRFLYLPSVLSCLGMGWILAAARQRIGRRLVVPLTLLPLAYGAGLLYQNFYWSDTERLLKGVIACRPRAADAANNLGTYYLRRGELSRALEMFTLAASRDSSLAEPIYNQGLVFQRLGRMAEAEHAYRRALELDPGHASAANNLGVLLSRRGYLSQAAELFRRAIRADPAHPQPLVNLAEVLVRQGKRAAAETLLHTALDIDPRLLTARLNLGRLLEGASRYEEAEHVYREAVELHPDSALAHNNLANLLARRGQRQQARQLYTRALELDPNLAPARYNLGLLLLRSGRLAAAREQLRQASRLRPRHLESWLALARLELQAGDRTAAARALARARELSPADPRLEELDRRLHDRSSAPAPGN